MNNTSSTWHVYMLRCNDGSLYTGITNDIDRRIKEHNDNKQGSKGAKYTRTRQPVVLVYSELVSNRSLASKREYEVKKLTRKQKLHLISSHPKNL